MRITAIINPVSGAGLDRSAADRRIALLRDTLARTGLSASIHLTERSGHARELAQAAVASHADLAIVWGGDGTVNEVGSGLMNSPTALGLVPAGSGNGLAAGLCVPWRPDAAIQKAVTSPVRTIDVGLLDDRPFFNVAGIGFDAHVAELFNRRGRGNRGRWPYVVIGVREGCRYSARAYRLRLDDEDCRSTALLMAFANGREYGSGACIAPGARLDDGLLEAAIVEDRPVLSRFLHTRYLAMGAFQRTPGVRFRQVRHATIETDGPIEFHVDGEPAVTRDRVEVRILPGALKVRA
jgi:YegS/Rv2252/BmrU family lipid kinase